MGGIPGGMEGFGGEMAELPAMSESVQNTDGGSIGIMLGISLVVLLVGLAVAFKFKR